MTERSERPNSSHFAFPYYFDGIGGVGGDLDNFPLSFPISFLGEGGEGMSPNRGICFGDLIIYIPPTLPSKHLYDLAIFYGDLQNTYVEGRCSRWDVQDYNIIVGTWIKKDELAALKENIRPGAVREFKRVITSPKFYDSSWKGYNTLRFYPVPSSQKMSDSNLYRMRKNTIAYVKNITEHPITNTEWIELKLECCISGGTL